MRARGRGGGVPAVSCLWGGDVVSCVQDAVAILPDALHFGHHRGLDDSVPHLVGLLVQEHPAGGWRAQLWGQPAGSLPPAAGPPATSPPTATCHPPVSPPGVQYAPQHPSLPLLSIIHANSHPPVTRSLCHSVSPSQTRYQPLAVTCPPLPTAVITSRSPLPTPTPAGSCHSRATLLTPRCEPTQCPHLASPSRSPACHHGIRGTMYTGSRVCRGVGDTGRGVGSRRGGGGLSPDEVGEDEELHDPVDDAHHPALHHHRLGGLVGEEISQAAGLGARGGHGQPGGGTSRGSARMRAGIRAMGRDRGGEQGRDTGSGKGCGQIEAGMRGCGQGCGRGGAEAEGWAQDGRRGRGRRGRWREGAWVEGGGGGEGGRGWGEGCERRPRGGPQCGHPTWGSPLWGALGGALGPRHLGCLRFGSPPCWGRCVRDCRF